MHGLGHPLRRQHSGKTPSFFSWPQATEQFCMWLCSMRCDALYMKKAQVTWHHYVVRTRQITFLLIFLAPTVLSILSQTKIRFLLNGLILHEKMSIFVIMHGIKIFQIFRNPVPICSPRVHTVFIGVVGLFLSLLISFLCLA